MKPLVFMVSTETYMENGDVFVDGIVTFDDHEIFRVQVVDPREAEQVCQILNHTITVRGS